MKYLLIGYIIHPFIIKFFNISPILENNPLNLGDFLINKIIRYEIGFGDQVKLENYKIKQ
jgi:hypothetical protein